MLDELHISNVALIRDASLCPASGLTAITGETGAGKTALLGALKLVAGERADAGLVRQGADSLDVEARFFQKDTPGEGVVAARSVSADGRSRVRIDGAPASVGDLAAGVGAGIDLCGQHEHQRLMKVSTHAAMLDAWAGPEAQEAGQSYRAAWQAHANACSELERIRSAVEVDDDRLEQARFIVGRIDEVSPTSTEYEELVATVPKAENAEALVAAVQTAHAAVAGEDGALDAVGQAAVALEGVSDIDPALGKVAEALREAGFLMEDAARDTRDYAQGIEFDAASLSAMQERMAAIQGLMRQWGPGIEDVMQRRESEQALLALSDDAQASIDAAQKQIDGAEENLQQAARELHRVRSEAAPQFARQVCEKMHQLDLQDAQLECTVQLCDRDNWSAQEADHVEFMFKPAAAMALRPLNKIASGGEVSRVMLAIKAVMGARDDVQTLVFDEVDAGVGGHAARTIATLLRDLSTTHQVIVVTHMAQVAAVADAHFVVTKQAGDNPETQIVAVQDEQRVREIARMLSGDATDASLSHARELLA